MSVARDYNGGLCVMSISYNICKNKAYCIIFTYRLLFLYNAENSVDAYKQTTITVTGTTVVKKERIYKPNEHFFVETIYPNSTDAGNDQYIGPNVSEFHNHKPINSNFT